MDFIKKAQDAAKKAALQLSARALLRIAAGPKSPLQVL